MWVSLFRYEVQWEKEEKKYCIEERERERAVDDDADDGDKAGEKKKTDKLHKERDMIERSEVIVEMRSVAFDRREKEEEER